MTAGADLRTGWQLLAAGGRRGVLALAASAGLTLASPGAALAVCPASVPLQGALTCSDVINASLPVSSWSSQLGEECDPLGLFCFGASHGYIGDRMLQIRLQVCVFFF